MLSILYPLTVQHLQNQLPDNAEWDELSVEDELPQNIALELLLTSSWFMNTFYLNPYALGLNIRIEGDLNGKIIEEAVQSAQILNKNRPVMMTFNSEREHKSLFIWRNKYSKLISMLLTNESSDMNEINSFIKYFIMYEIRNDRTGINSDFSEKVNNYNHIDPRYLCDKDGYNLMMLAAERGEDKVVEYLLKFFFNLDYEVSTENSTVPSAPNLAWANKQNQGWSNVLLKLLNYNSQFPTNFIVEESTPELVDFTVNSEYLHLLIDQENYAEMIRIIKENPHLKYFYNRNNQSAAYYSLTQEKFQAYSLLLKCGVTCGPNEHPPSDLEYNYKIYLRNLHKEHAKDIPDKHLDVLNVNSFIAPDHDAKNKDYRGLIKEAYQTLNSIATIRQILEYVGASKNFKVMFDFKRSFTSYIDPVYGFDAKGLFYPSRVVCIAAKELENPTTKHITYGTMAQEFCHFALFLLFKNNCKPYAVNNAEKAQIFENISVECLQKVDYEEAIKNVYDAYEPNLWHAELAARVPEIYAKFFNDEQGLNFAKDTFATLFGYFETEIIPKFASTFDALKKLEDPAREIKWNELPDDWKEVVRNSDVNFQGNQLKICEIISRNSMFFNDFPSNIVKGLLNLNSLKIGVEPEELGFYIERRLYNGSMSLNFNEILSIQNILLSNNPGEGKTSFFKRAAKVLKEKYPSKWVQFIEVSAIKSESLLNNDQSENIYNILNLQPFDKIIFRDLFLRGEVIFLWDGLSGIKADDKIKLLNLIRDVRQTSNWQWISSFTNHANEIARNFKTNVFSLLDFTEDEVKVFVSHTCKKDSISQDKENALMNMLGIFN